MINHIWFYSLFPFAIALLCLLLLVKLFRNESAMQYRLLFSFLFLMNAAQSAGYIVFEHSTTIASIFATSYLISACWFFYSLVIVAGSLATPSFSQKTLITIALFPLIVTILHPLGYIVESYRVEQNSLMHDDGQLAFIQDILMLGCCVATWIILFRNIKRAGENRILASRNILALLSFAPIILVMFAVVLLSTTENAVSVAFISPAITGWTAIIFYYISRKNIVDVSMGFWHFAKRLRIAADYIFSSSRSKETRRSLYQSIERQDYVEVLERHNYNVKDAAAELQIAQSSLYAKMNELNISHPTATPSSKQKPSYSYKD